MCHDLYADLRRRNCVLLLLLLLLSYSAAAQGSHPQTATEANNGSSPKPALDVAAFTDWPSIPGDSPAISNDGQYVSYLIVRGPGQPEDSQVFVVQAAKRDWKVEIVGAASGKFTADSHRAVFLRADHSLCTLTLGTSSSNCVSGVSSFTLIPREAGELVAYESADPVKELVVRDLATGSQQSFPGVTGHLFSNDGNTLLLRTETASGGAPVQTLTLVSVADEKTTTIWQGVGADNFVFDASGTQLAFTVETKVNDQVSHSFCYYKQGTDKTVLLSDDHAPGADKGMKLDRLQRFSNDGSRLFFTMNENLPAPNPDSIKVDVWSYTDAQIQPLQLEEARGPQIYAAVFYIQDHRIIRLQQENERIELGANYGAETDDVVVVGGPKGRWKELDLSNNYDPFYLVSTRTGERKRLPQGMNAGELRLSPGGKYIVSLGPKLVDWYSYEVATGLTRNITKSIPTPIGESGDDYDTPEHGQWRGLALRGWLRGDAAALTYDAYDIWLVDPLGKKAPINLTNGYGRRHNITFRLAHIHHDWKPIADDELILQAFDNKNKNNGFYKINTQQRNHNPELLTMGPYLYGSANGKDIEVEWFSLVKARDAQVYLVGRESATESPTLFWTEDLETYTPITDVHPERNYNWLTSKLVLFPTVDGRTQQGVLYRPENFDPRKKYPVILLYYERKSDNLNTFPELIDGNGGFISIPWFVSHGYIVFTPDIVYPSHREMGHDGESAYNAVVGAAKYLSRLPWVDSKHIGIQGHSFSGFETYYLVTHTDMFAAAVSSCGPSNAISEYGDLWGWGGPKLGYYENRQGRMGATLWERPDVYIENSPVFRADKVSTPILTMGNKNDGNVKFSQSLQWFMAMRRLGKRAWMLQYDDGSHGVHGNDYVDYTLRTQQFFDHYLRGAPPPKWMTQGIPAKLKGIETGLELDTSGKEPRPLPVTPPEVVIH